MSKRRITLELLNTYEELAESCRENWQYEEICPMGGVFKCPFFGVEKRCYAVTAEMWDATCITDYEED